jgi:hypothetical protein
MVTSAADDPKRDKNKKEPPFPAARSDNREASNRVDRSHSTSMKMDENQ